MRVGQVSSACSWKHTALGMQIASLSTGDCELGRCASGAELRPMDSFK